MIMKASKLASLQSAVHEAQKHADAVTRVAVVACDEMNAAERELFEYQKQLNQEAKKPYWLLRVLCIAGSK